MTDCILQWDESTRRWCCQTEGCTHKDTRWKARRNCNGGDAIPVGQHEMPSKNAPKTPPLAKEVCHLVQDLAAAAKDLFRRVSKEVYHERLRICKECDVKLPSGKRCGECGCWLKAKARLRAWNCDLGHWPHGE